MSSRLHMGSQILFLLLLPCMLCVFFLWLFLRIVPLSFVFSILTMMCLGMLFFVPSFYCACWICGLLFLINLGKLWRVFFFQILSLAYAVPYLFLGFHIKTFGTVACYWGSYFFNFFLSVLSGYSTETEPIGDLSLYYLSIYQSIIYLPSYLPTYLFINLSI